MRLLALADEAPADQVERLVARNGADAVAILGDLPEDVLAQAGGAGVPAFGVHGNHDAPGALTAFGIEDLHLASRTEGDVSFSGFEGCVRYRRGAPHQYGQGKAERLARRLPAADVLLCHCPPRGVNDEPDDPAHVGFDALRDWVCDHRPRLLLHGHTTPDPRTRTSRLGSTTVVWVRGARVLDIGPPL